MTASTTQISRARAEQVNRVNGAAYKLEEEIADLRQRLETVKAMYRAEQSRADALSLELDALRASPPPYALGRGSGGGVGGVSYNARPTITPAVAARRTGISRATISRYLTEGWWQGVQFQNGEWLIFSDQTLARKRK